jgi:hypothetical protein
VATINRLIEVLDNQKLAAAIERMEKRLRVEGREVRRATILVRPQCRWMRRRRST